MERTRQSLLQNVMRDTCRGQKLSEKGSVLIQTHYFDVEEI